MLMASLWGLAVLLVCPIEPLCIVLQAMTFSSAVLGQLEGRGYLGHLTLTALSEKENNSEIASDIGQCLAGCVSM